VESADECFGGASAPTAQPGLQPLWLAHLPFQDRAGNTKSSQDPRSEWPILESQLCSPG